jgi:hypothetical protein
LELSFSNFLDDLVHVMVFSMVDYGIGCDFLI